MVKTLTALCILIALQVSANSVLYRDLFWKKGLGTFLNGSAYTESEIKTQIQVLAQMTLKSQEYDQYLQALAYDLRSHLGGQ